MIMIMIIHIICIYIYRYIEREMSTHMICEFVFICVYIYMSAWCAVLC